MSLDSTRGNFALDVQGLSRLRHSAAQDPQANLRETSQQFEALFLQKMLKSMRDAIPESDLLSSNSVDQYTDLMDRQWSQHLAGQGFGLSDMLTRQLSKGGEQGEEGDPLSRLREASRSLGDDAVIPLNEAQRAANARLASTDSAGGGAFERHGPLIEGYAGLETGPARSDEKRTDALIERASGVEHQKLMADVAPHVASFVDTLGGAARRISEQTGIPDRLILAQAALETGWGARGIRAEDGGDSHNLFGIKATGGWQGESSTITTTEYENGAARKLKDDFRVYDSWEASMADYARLLTENPRYERVMAANTPEAAARELQSAGYATDPRYADKLVSIMSQLPENAPRAAMGESLFSGGDLRDVRPDTADAGVSPMRQREAALAYAMERETSRIF